MLKTVLSKITWIGRATTFCVGLAVILAVVLGGATAAFAGNGDLWILGQFNAATAITRLGGSTGVDGPMLQITNNDAGVDDTALDLRVQAGEVPMKVNSDRKVDNLNADELDSVDSTEFYTRRTRTYIESASQMVTGNGGFGGRDVYCDPGDKLAGGGGGFSEHGSLATTDTLSMSQPVKFDKPDDGIPPTYGWMVWGQDNGPASKQTAYAVCVDFEPFRP